MHDTGRSTELGFRLPAINATTTRLSWMSVQTQSRHPTVAEPGPQTPTQVHVPQLRLGTDILHLVRILKDCGPGLIYESGGLNVY